MRIIFRINFYILLTLFVGKLPLISHFTAVETRTVYRRRLEGPIWIRVHSKHQVFPNLECRASCEKRQEHEIHLLHPLLISDDGLSEAGQVPIRQHT